MQAGESEASSVAGGETALIGALIVLGIGKALSEAEGIPHFGEELSLFAKVLLGHGCGQASLRTGGGTSDDLRRGAGVMQLGEDVMSVTGGRGNARVVGVDGLLEVEVPVLNVAVIKEALKGGMDVAVAALTGAIPWGW